MRLTKVLTTAPGLLLAAVAATGFDELYRAGAAHPGSGADEKWREGAALREPGRAFFNVEFSPDGKAMAAAGLGGLVTVWDVASREARRSLTTGHRGAASLAFSPDGKTIATFASEGEVRLWDVATGKRRKAWRVPVKKDGRAPDRVVSGGVRRLAFSPDGKSLAAAQGDVVRVWDVGTARELAVLAGHSDDVRTVAYGLGGKVLVTGSLDETLKVWDTGTAKELASLRGPADGHFALSGDGKTLAAAYPNDHGVSVTLWDVGSGKEKATWKDAKGALRLAFSRDGKTLATQRVEVRLWDVASGKKLAAFEPGGSNAALALAFSPDGRALAAVGYEVELPSEDRTGLLLLWELRGP